MKKALPVLVYISFAIIFGILIYYFIISAQTVSMYSSALQYSLQHLQHKIENPELLGNTVEQIEQFISSYGRLLAESSIQMSSTLLALFGAVYLFIFYHMKAFKKSQEEMIDRKEKRKQKRLEKLQATIDKEEARKQKRLEELQAEIDELKK